jgi:hypothetical protein
VSSKAAPSPDIKAVQALAEQGLCSTLVEITGDLVAGPGVGIPVRPSQNHLVDVRR